MTNSTTAKHAISLVNLRDGSVEGHKAGCADLKRGHRKQASEAWTFEVADKAEARAEYNADFDYETDGWYEINWLPCAKHVPAGTDIAEAPVVEEPTVTVKVGRKWTYIYAADGSLIAEVRNDSSAAVIAALQA